jgi:hypothetical protein
MVQWPVSLTHVAFDINFVIDYISPRLTKRMIENGKQACFKKDKKGYLPAHVACMRHCSPEKLLMLLKANPGSLTAKTNEGQTLLSLAIQSATKSHPNYALIDELQRNLCEAEKRESIGNVPIRVSSDDTNDSKTKDNEVTYEPTTRARKRKVTNDDADDPASLLLHFSRHGTDKKIKYFATV